MSSALDIHINEIKNNRTITKEELKSFVSKFEVLGSVGITANAILYVLNLNKMNYEYINNGSYAFTGKTPDDFYEKGMSILPEIIVAQDFEVLSKVLFPKMNALTYELTKEEKQNVVFELYYRMTNAKQVTAIVEYSSYSKVDESGTPILSTGVCYQSPQNFNGVRGIVRINTNTEQKTLFDETIHHSFTVLTTKEKEIVAFLKQGKTRKEIAENLYISLHTCNTHVKNIYKKLGIHKISDLK